MIIEHFIIARDSSVDRDKNTLSVFDFVEDFQMAIPRGQTAMIPVQVLAVFKREPSDASELNVNMQITVVGPDAQVMAKSDVAAQLAQTHSRQRIRLNLPLAVNQSGRFTFRIQRADQPSFAKELSIMINVVPQIPQQMSN